ncbi:bifunctional riboflavin kinase/FAD synthetase [Mesobacillus maritimus]|uniref:bifunctional riboflavin kinase/FAD synthetase n=1 Tax=Mesobacillus maritimus TaxID=1643336 RepID=UPI00203E6D22|nr:bifunctional riboflavin kinase/FAD synthetase [Mesobacillus maritimus]MCM3667759.1 bifunctional riboflavin kinase/FAD synthetase [Mesobacillus maritimus]
MELIKLNHPHLYKSEDFSPQVMALGYFDGVHLGHQEVMKEAIKIAKEKGMKSAVMTFDPHPSVVLGKKVQHVEYITPIEEKIRVIENMGVDRLYIVHFTREFANLLPQEFIDDYIIQLNVKHVVAGFDYTYGKMGKGTMETIQFHSREQFEYTIVPKLAVNGEKVSSTLIRTFLLQGKVDAVPLLLGRYYTSSGVVGHGDKRGRTIGFPTANVDVFEEFILPPTGVYAVRLLVDGKWHNGVCNLGYKPTFNNQKAAKPTVEVHIFDFNQDIYGKLVIVEWHQKIRDEQKFSGIDALVEQINQDKQQALDYFEKQFA